MVRIFNIILSDNLISCKYTPEDSSEEGKLTVNTVTREITDISYSNFEYGKKTYAHHAYLKLLELFDNGKPFPKEAFSTWY